jgi:subtilase family serine protease
MSQNMLCFAVAIIALGSTQAHAQRLEQNVPAGIQFAKDLGRVDGSTAVNVTVHLKLNDKTAFDQAVDALYDRNSPTYHHWMTNDDLRQYAPSKTQAEVVRQELEKHGLTILATDSLGFTIRARGTIANVESAFQTELHNFSNHGTTYRANVRNARLTGAAGDYVETVAGVESHSASPLIRRAVDPLTNEPHAPIPLVADSGFPAGSTTDCMAPAETLNFGTSLPTATYTGAVYAPTGTCNYLPYQLQTAYGMPDVYTAGYDGAGQTIALVEAFGYPQAEQDGNAFSKLAGLPLLNSSNYSTVYPEGKPNHQVGPWSQETALDIDTAHTIAPGANIVMVISTGNDDEDFQQCILYIAEHNLAYSVSNSYETNIDAEAGSLEHTSWDNILEIATAKGISVNFSTGDAGDNGVLTPVGAAGVPSDEPHATAVGGTAVFNDLVHPGKLVTTGWGESSVQLTTPSVLDPPSVGGFGGGGGGGESLFWPKPSWQSAIPGKGRQTPDVSALADPRTGVTLLRSEEYDGLQFQLIEYGVGGTSVASPLFSAMWAIANQVAGAPLGQAARLIAAQPSSVEDVLPKSDNSVYNVTGTITDSTGPTIYSASQLFSFSLEGNTQFTSALQEDFGGVISTSGSASTAP